MEIQRERKFMMTKMSEKSLKNLKSGEHGQNRTGRPKGSLNRKTLFDKWSEVKSKTKNPLTQKVEGLTQDDLVVLSLLDKAKKGDIVAIREWLDSRFGKVKDIVEIESEKENDKIQDLINEINESRFKRKFEEKET